MEFNKHTMNIQDEGIIERVIAEPENDDTVDVSDEVHTTNFATLREPLLEDAGLL